MVVLAVVISFSYRAMWQHRIANKTRVTSPNGIDEANFIKVNGAEEWITIRGDNIENPVILFLIAALKLSRRYRIIFLIGDVSLPDRRYDRPGRRVAGHPVLIFFRPGPLAPSRRRH
jgi:hypothetical protein